MHNRYFGIDYGSRRIAMAMISEIPMSNPRVWIERFGTDYTDFDALGEAYQSLETRARMYRPLVIAIESPIVGASKNAQTAVKMSMMAGALAAAAGRTRSGILFAAPATWKKDVVGRGNANKSDVAKWLFREHPAVYAACAPPGSDKADQDAIDAFCLALHARGSVGERSVL